MQSLGPEHDIHLRLTYTHEGKDVEVAGNLSWVEWDIEQNYSDVVSYHDTFRFYETGDIQTLRFSPNGALQMKVSDPPKRAVREVLRTAETQASGTTVAAFEEARKAVGAPADALIELDRWSYPEAIQIGAGDPVKVRFSWTETV